LAAWSVDVRQGDRWRVCKNAAQQQAAQAQQQAAQAQQAQQAQASAKLDPMQELAKLGDLNPKGLITEEEFQKMKANILAKM